MVDTSRKRSLLNGKMQTENTPVCVQIGHQGLNIPQDVTVNNRDKTKEGKCVKCGRSTERFLLL